MDWLRGNEHASYLKNVFLRLLPFIRVAGVLGLSINDETFDGWVRQYSRLLFGIAYWWTSSRTEAEELTQEAFFQAYRSRHSLRDVSLVKGWLVGILRNCDAQTRRKSQSGLQIPLDELLHDPAAKESISEETLSLHQTLNRLDEHHRMPLVLFYFEDMSYRDISEALEIPIGTVMSRMSRAKQLLHRGLSLPTKLVVVPKREVR